VLDRLPVLPSGKVDRKALQSVPGKVLANEQAIVPPRTQAQNKLGRGVQELLHVDQIRLNQKFPNACHWYPPLRVNWPDDLALLDHKKAGWSGMGPSHG